MSNAQPNLAGQPSEMQISIPTTRPIATYVLLAVLVGIFLIQVVINQANYPVREPLTDWGELDFLRVMNGEYYRLLTAMFLHVSEVHLFFNGLALYYSGQFVESFFGRTRFLLIYFLGGLSGSLLSLILTRGPSIGASGAIFAVFGAQIAFLYRNRLVLGQRGQQALRSMAVLMAINFGFGVLTNITPSQIVVDNWGHIGGLIGGLALGWLIGPQYRVQREPSTVIGYAIEDANTLAKTWQFPALFAVILIIIFIVALHTLR